MLIDIQNIPISYINLEKDYMKNIAIQEMLYGYSNLNRIEATYIKDNHVLALAMSQKDALDSITVPGLILEDDCVKANFRTQINVPDDADIVFLGIWDMDKPAIPSGKYLPAYEIHDEDFVKVYSMNGSHAILFVSELGKQVASRAYDISIRTELWNDSILNRVLPFVNAYALRSPIFAQTSQLDKTNIEYSGEFEIRDPNYLDSLINIPDDISNL